MKNLIAIDSDGTLKYSDGSISQNAKKIIKKLIDYGEEIVICTARPRLHAKEVCKSINLNSYLISSDGAEIYDIKNSKVLWDCYLNKKVCNFLINEALKRDLRVVIAINDTEYVTKNKVVDKQVLFSKDNLLEVLKNDIKQIMIIDVKKDDVKSLEEIIKEKYDVNINHSSDLLAKHYWFSITSKKTSKGYALLRLAQYLKIDDSNIIAIGNDENDISMFDISSLAVAVSNSSDKVLEKADIIIDKNDNDGVAKFLKEFYSRMTNVK